MAVKVCILLAVSMFTQSKMYFGFLFSARGIVALLYGVYRQQKTIFIP
jgi:hypothetical protein